MVSRPEIADAGYPVESAPSLTSAWEAARSGDAEARAGLARLAHEIALRELSARRAAPSEIEDLAQESVRSFLAYLGGSGEAPLEIRAFLKWRALGVLSDQRKRRRARAMEITHVDTLEPTVEGVGPIAAAVAEQVRGALADCRARLGADMREALALRYEGGLEVGEIADRLGVTRNAIHVRTFRALAALRECLVRKGIEPEDAP